MIKIFPATNSALPPNCENVSCGPIWLKKKIDVHFFYGTETVTGTEGTGKSGQERNEVAFQLFWKDQNMTKHIT